MPTRGQPYQHLEPSMLTISDLGEAKYPTPLSYRICNDPEDIGFVNSDHGVLGVIDKECHATEKTAMFEKAGPRETLFFEAGKTISAVVTCGGLCPGLNAVIRSLVMMSHYRYKNPTMLGIRYGYNGLSMQNKTDPIELTPDVVREIDHDGGTILGSSRGRPEISEMIERLLELGIQILYVIGGDGTQKGALALKAELERRNLPIAIIGIPKTIDNDIALIDRSFGFESAFSKACEAIRAGAVEAKAGRNGISIIKLMGRDSGFVAAYAALAASHVNFCLIPEIDFDLEGENGLLEYIRKRVLRRGHAVVVVAEGAGQRFFEGLEKRYDASGNEKLADIGLLLKEQIKLHFDNTDTPCSIKYIDPSYIIRSCPPTANDIIFCSHLGQMAVHAAMAGKTGMVVGKVHNRFVHIPMALASQQRKRIDPHSQIWHTVLELTGQPHLMRNVCDL